MKPTFAEGIIKILSIKSCGVAFEINTSPEFPWYYYIRGAALPFARHTQASPKGKNSVSPEAAL